MSENNHKKTHNKFFIILLLLICTGGGGYYYYYYKHAESINNDKNVSFEKKLAEYFQKVDTMSTREFDKKYLDIETRYNKAYQKTHDSLPPPLQSKFAGMIWDQSSDYRSATKAEYFKKKDLKSLSFIESFSPSEKEQFLEAVQKNENQLQKHMQDTLKIHIQLMILRSAKSYKDKGILTQEEKKLQEEIKDFFSYHFYQSLYRCRDFDLAEIKNFMGLSEEKLRENYEDNKSLLARSLSEVTKILPENIRKSMDQYRLTHSLDDVIKDKEGLFKSLSDEERESFVELMRKNQDLANQFAAFTKQIIKCHLLLTLIEKEAIKQEAIKQEAIKQEAIKQEAIKQEAIEQEAIKQEAIKQEAIEQEAIEQEAIKQEAIKQEAIKQEAIKQELLNVLCESTKKDIIFCALDDLYENFSSRMR